jgi:hypothetical protein
LEHGARQPCRHLITSGAPHSYYSQAGCFPRIGKCAVPCKTCQALIADYRNLASHFKDAVRNRIGAIGEDSTRGAAEVERLRRECQDVEDRLRAHWRQDHPELARSSRL